LERTIVLRLGHRPARDKRLTTHVALTARALGAEGIVIYGPKDSNISRSIRRVVERWGGSFSINFCSSWKPVITDWLEGGGEVIHLTMYGLPLLEVIDKIRSSSRDKLVVVGAEKVPSEIYKLATHNVSVTNQPISEVSALGIFLDRYFCGKEMQKEFEDHEIRIIPQKRGKKVIQNKSDR